MIATNLEQSKHLLELGLSPDSADMFWKYSASLGNTDINGKIAVSYHDNLFVGKYDGAIPAWSLSALLEVMPNNDYWEICLWQYKDQRWQCVFDDVEFSNGETKSFVADTPIAAAYEMVCWLLENNLIEKGDK